MSTPRKYQIWDKQSPVACYTGQVFTAEEWIEQHPIINLPGVVPVMEAGDTAGGSFATLGQLKRNAEMMGAVFSEGLTDEELLEAIEDFEAEINAPVDPDTLPPTTEERTAAALELIAMSSLPDVEV